MYHATIRRLGQKQNSLDEIQCLKTRLYEQSQSKVRDASCHCLNRSKLSTAYLTICDLIVEITSSADEVMDGLEVIHEAVDYQSRPSPDIFTSMSAASAFLKNLIWLCGSKPHSDQAKHLMVHMLRVSGGNPIDQSEAHDALADSIWDSVLYLGEEEVNGWGNLIEQPVLNRARFGAAGDEEGACPEPTVRAGGARGGILWYSSRVVDGTGLSPDPKSGTEGR